MSRLYTVLSWLVQQKMESTTHSLTEDTTVCLFVLLVLYLYPCSAHAVHIGTDRILLMGHNALLLQQTAGDLLHAFVLHLANFSMDTSADLHCVVRYGEKKSPVRQG